MMGTSRPTLDVIITCFNYERYVAQSIESVLAQSEPATNVIVIDDGSTDGSADVIRSFGNAVQAVIQSNMGKVGAVNEGFARSTADIVLFLDADDLLADGALEAVLHAWTPETVKAQFNLAIIDAEGRSLDRIFCNFPANYTPEQLHRDFLRTGTYQWPVTSGNAYARSFLLKHLPMIPPVSQDGVLNTIAPLYGDVQTIDRPLGKYRIHNQNLSRRDKAGRARKFPDFGRRIAFRMAEFDVLRQHASVLGTSLPSGNLIDQELVFVNYRLMAKRIGDAYPGSDRESALDLWRNAAALIAKGQYGAGSRAAHLLWATSLLLSPRTLARQLVGFRFDRAAHIGRLRDIAGRVGRKREAGNPDAGR